MLFAWGLAAKHALLTRECHPGVSGACPALRAWNAVLQQRRFLQGTHELRQLEFHAFEQRIWARIM
ncbi:hypothetical protein [Azohydromonas australica]|uniref:hypothetical protein n=1 Tax=Azohydromonas australica TaxID=364039 RepID=UPI000405FC74|nr:hypothetical protein [Azohydromonas australica]